MISVLERLRDDGLITSSEAEEAILAAGDTDQDHTIGYELEVLPTAADETPRVERLKVADEDTYRESMFDALRQELSPYGYGIAAEGEYELKSPPANHPLPLAVATRGLVRAGWLPETADGMVTAHVSIGYPRDGADRKSTKDRMVDVLRAVELSGGSTPGRLNAPVRITRERRKLDFSPSWNRYGFLGIAERYGPRWQSQQRRAEFRTLRYTSSDQFGAAMEHIYFLTKGLLSAEGSDARLIYDEFADWFGDYRREHSLPEAGSIPGSDESSRHVMDAGVLDAYMRPYVDHLGRGDTAEIRDRVAETTGSLAEAFDIPVAA